MEMKNSRFNNGNKNEIKKSILNPSSPFLDADFETLFKGWFGNQMTVLLMLLQRVRAGHEKTIWRIQFFLHDLEHHYAAIYCGRYGRHAFRYLRRFFKVYPRVNAGHCQRALQMVQRIYEMLGFEVLFKIELSRDWNEIYGRKV